jgi:hypothetical protein
MRGIYAWSTRRCHQPSDRHGLNPKIDLEAGEINRWRERIHPAVDEGRTARP